MKNIKLIFVIIAAAGSLGFLGWVMWDQYGVKPHRVVLVEPIVPTEQAVTTPTPAPTATPTLNLEVTKALTAQFEQENPGTDVPVLSDDLSRKILTAYLAGQLVIDNKIEDPANPGAHSFRAIVPSYETPTTYCGIYGEHLCVIMYEDKGKAKILGLVSGTGEGIADVLPEGVLLEGTNGDAGYGVHTYTLLTRDGKTRTEIANIAIASSDGPSIPSIFDITANEEKMSIVMTEGMQVSVQIKDGDRVLKTYAPSEPIGGWITVDAVQTLRNPKKIYFALGERMFVFDGSVKPARLIEQKSQSIAEQLDAEYQHMDRTLTDNLREKIIGAYINGNLRTSERVKSVDDPEQFAFVISLQPTSAKELNCDQSVCFLAVEKNGVIKLLPSQTMDSTLPPIVYYSKEGIYTSVTNYDTLLLRKTSTLTEKIETVAWTNSGRGEETVSVGDFTGEAAQLRCIVTPATNATRAFVTFMTEGREVKKSFLPEGMDIRAVLDLPKTAANPGKAYFSIGPIKLIWDTTVTPAQLTEQK